MNQFSDAVNLLERTLGTLRRHGWVKGMMGSPRSGFCLVGALEYTSREMYGSGQGYGAPGMRRAVEALYEVMYRRKPVMDIQYVASHVAHWNDSQYSVEAVNHALAEARLMLLKQDLEQVVADASEVVEAYQELAKAVPTQPAPVTDWNDFDKQLAAYKALSYLPVIQPQSVKLVAV